MSSAIASRSWQTGARRGAEKLPTPARAVILNGHDVDANRGTTGTRKHRGRKSFPDSQCGWVRHTENALRTAHPNCWCSPEARGLTPNRSWTNRSEGENRLRANLRSRGYFRTASNLTRNQHPMVSDASVRRLTMQPPYLAAAASLSAHEVEEKASLLRSKIC
jgi:hypothetical protein